jgi:dTDP-4-dehydrorhamnose reductase
MFTDHIITPTFVDDVAKVFDYCVSNKPHGLYHMVGSSSHSDYEIASMVKTTFGYTTEIKEGSLAAYIESSKRPYQRSMKISNQKLVSEFGISMKTLEQGLDEMKRQMGM